MLCDHGKSCCGATITVRAVRINATTIVALGFGAFSVGRALFLILELSQPFSGVFRIPSGAYDQMLESLM